MYEIQEIRDPKEKAAICGHILHALPAWFGIESSIQEYIALAESCPLWAAYADGQAVGFMMLKPHTPYAIELAVTGVLPDHHRRGIGKALLQACEAYCRAQGASYLTVKTLDASRESQSYARTRQYYQAMGFVPLEVFPTLWDAANPCLLMIKSLG